MIVATAMPAKTAAAAADKGSPRQRHHHVADIRAGGHHAFEPDIGDAGRCEISSPNATRRTGTVSRMAASPKPAHIRAAAREAPSSNGRR